MKNLHRRLTALAMVWLVVGNASQVMGAIVARRLDQTLKADWTRLPDGKYSIVPRVSNLDINGDSQPDLYFEHNLTPPLLNLGVDGSNQLLAAKQGLDEVNHTLIRIRNLALNSANSQSYDELANNQAQVSHMLEYINRMSNITYEGRALLDGSAGLTGFSENPDLFEVVNVTTKTTPGKYVASVTSPASRAVVLAGVRQTAAVAADETLTVNGLNVDLKSGMLQHHVVNRINEYRGQTGVWAEIRDGVTTLVSDLWGANSWLCGISNIAMSHNSSGFGTTFQCDVGTDQVVEVGGTEHLGKGNMTVVANGPGRGLTLRTRPSRDNAAVSGSGSTNIWVVDQSLDFLLNPPEQGQHLRVSLPRVHSSALGDRVESSSFGTLDEILVNNSLNAQDALALIDAAINEISAEISTLQVLQDIYVNPRGKALVSANNSSGDAQIQLRLWEEGTLIDHTTQFHQDDLELMATEFGNPHYLGLRILIGNELHYGWMQIRIREDHSLRLVDWAYESQPEKGILVGYVPEPQIPFAGIVACVLGLRNRRLRNGTSCL